MYSLQKHVYSTAASDIHKAADMKDTDIAIRTRCINISPICRHSQCCDRLVVALYEQFQVNIQQLY